MTVINLTDINTACQVIDGNFSGSCIYIYGSDYALLSLKTIAVCMIFIVVYILYKEVVK